jgi:hypothetical protein
LSHTIYLYDFVPAHLKGLQPHTQEAASQRCLLSKLKEDRQLANYRVFFSFFIPEVIRTLKLNLTGKLMKID